MNQTIPQGPFRPSPGVRRSAPTAREHALSGLGLRGPSRCRALRALGLALVLAAPACNDTKSPGFSSNPEGTVIEHPDASSSSSKRFIVDRNRLGRASELRIARLAWGRLVDIYDRDANGVRTLQHKDFVIGSDIVADASNFQLETDIATAGDELTILHPFGGNDGIRSPDDAYEIAFARLERNLLPLEDDPVDGVGIFTLLPRNAAVVIQFDDLVDPDTVNARTVRVLTGYPPVTPYTARIFPDQNHGDLARRSGDSSPRFYSSRVIIDATISEVDSFASSPPLAVNAVGLPASTSPNLANVALRIPTVEKPGIGQDLVVENLTGHRLALQNNGTVDFNSPTLDIVRGLRAGGRTIDTGDPFNGFLRDDTRPELVSVQPILIGPGIVNQPGGDDRDFLLPITLFLTTACAREPLVGDLIRQGDRYLRVTDPGAGLDVNVLEDLAVRLIAGDPAEFLQSGQGAARYLSTFDPLVDSLRPRCFVQVTPPAGGFPDAPSTDISTTASFTVRFSEVMDPDSMRAFDSLLLQRVDTAPTETDIVVSRIEASVDVRQFTIVPDLPLAHASGTSETYFLVLTEGEFGPTDLAGNQPLQSLPITPFTVEAGLASQNNGGRVLRFTSDDELGANDLPEWVGHHTYDLVAQEIRPRPVVRYEAILDRTQAVVQLMGSQPTAVQVPLTKFGNKLQSIWRNGDVNYRLDDPTTYDVDVERMSWAPVGGDAIPDHFRQFEISMAHSKWHPDELLVGIPPVPVFPNSGMKPTYAVNLLDPVRDPLRIVHPRERGYTISPGDVFAASTGTLFLPYPLNRGIPISEYRYYTWRDTGLRTRGGFDLVDVTGNMIPGGVDTTAYLNTGNGVRWFSTDRAETIGLPLLTEFKCFPDDQAFGLNVLDVGIAVTVSARPAFRVFSAGGVDQSEAVVRRDPDLETEANGGFNPLSTPPGQPTRGDDPVVYLGSLDLVTRIARSYSVWFSVPGTGGTTMFNPPVLEPSALEQPTGTRILVAFRGALLVMPTALLTNANLFDGYGDAYATPTLRDDPNPDITFLNGTDQEWKPEASQIDGATFYQLRLTFESDTETGVGPVLSGLGVTWQRP